MTTSFTKSSTSTRHLMKKCGGQSLGSPLSANLLALSNARCRSSYAAQQTYKHKLVSCCLTGMTETESCVDMCNFTYLFTLGWVKWSKLNWIGLCSVLRPHQHSIGYMGDGFYRSKDPTNSIKVLKEQIVQIKHTISRHKHKTQQIP